MKTIDVCKEYNLSQPTLSTWKKQKAKLKDMVDAGKVLDTKRNCESFLPNVKRALHIWFGEMRSKQHALTTQQTSTHREGYIVSVFNQFDI